MSQISLFEHSDNRLVSAFSLLENPEMREDRQGTGLNQFNTFSLSLNFDDMLQSDICSKKPSLIDQKSRLTVLQSGYLTNNFSGEELK